MEEIEVSKKSLDAFTSEWNLMNENLIFVVNAVWPCSCSSRPAAQATDAECSGNGSGNGSANGTKKVKCFMNHATKEMRPQVHVLLKQRPRVWFDHGSGQVGII